MAVRVNSLCILCLWLSPLTPPPPIPHTPANIAQQHFPFSLGLFYSQRRVEGRGLPHMSQQWRWSQPRIDSIKLKDLFILWWILLSCHSCASQHVVELYNSIDVFFSHYTYILRSGKIILQQIVRVLYKNYFFWRRNYSVEKDECKEYWKKLL